jgi:hypothetical protein
MPDNNLPAISKEQALKSLSFKEIGLTPRNYMVSVQDKSQYDTGFVVPQFGSGQEALAEYRAQQQPWYDKLTNSVNKGVGLAGTTLIDTFAGTAAGLINMGVAATEGQSGYEIFNAFVNNPVSVALNDFNEMLASDVLVNYRTKKEMDNAWYENAIGMGGISGITNFWGEDVLKNAGFMVGAMYGGKGLASLGSKLTRLEEGRKEFTNLKKSVENIMSGVDLPNTKTQTLINAFKNSPELYTLEAAKVMDDFAKAAISTRKKEFGIQLAASTLGSFGEARIEAIGNGNAYRQEREKELNQAFQAGQLNEQEYQQALGRIDKEVTAYQNSSFLANSLLLSGSNYMGLRNAYLRPYDYAVKNRVGEAVKIAEGAEKGLYKYISPTKLEVAGKSALNILRESQEEQLQFAIDKTVGQWVRTNKNGENIKSLFEAMGEGLTEAYGSEEGLENAFIGGLFGAIGFGGGGAISEYKDIMKRSKEEQTVVDNLNKLIKENKLEDKSVPLLKAIVRDFNLQAKRNKAIDNSDQYTYEETKDEKFFNIANGFIDAGKMEDLIDLYKEENELSADQLRLKYSYLKDANDPNSRVSYFQNRTDDEIKEYFREKTSNAINEVKKLRDLKDNLSTLYRNEFIKIKNKEGADMEIKVKDFLTEQFYMGEARDKRLLKLKNEILNEVNEYIPEDLRYELANDQDFSEFFNEDDSLNTYKLIEFLDKKISRKFGKEKVEDIKKASKETKDALERENKTFDKLVDILNNYNKKTLKFAKNKEGKYKKDDKGKFIISQSSKKRYALINDYITLLSEKALSNFYLAQLSNNDFSKLIQELKKAENEVEKEVEKNVKSNTDDDDKYNELIQDAKNAGYVTKSDLVYFTLNGELHRATYDPDGKRTSKNVFTDKVLLVDNKNTDGNIVNSFEPDIFDRSFLIENYGKIKFVSQNDANNIIERQKVVENIQALSYAVNEQVSTINNSIDEINKEIEDWKQQKQDLITESSILLEDIKNTAYNRNYTEKRKQWKKQLKNLQDEVTKIDNKINKLNEFKSELQSQIDGLNELKTNIEGSKSIVNFSQIANTIADIILEKEIDAELINKGLDTIESLDNVILELEDEKRYIQKVVDQLEEILLASDTTIKSHYVIMDATFKNKWVNEVGLNYLLNNNGKSTKEDFIKNFPTIKRKLRQYSERVGISLKEAFDEFDNELNELKKLEKRYQDQYELENLLITNKQDLDRVSNALEDLYKRYDKAIKNDSLNKRYNAVTKNLEKLSILYSDALNKIKSSRNIQETIYDGYSDPEDNDSTNNIINIDNNTLSNEVFYTTGRDANNVNVNGVYIDVLNEQGLPELNSDPSARAFMNFANNFFSEMNDSKTNLQYALQVFKYDPNTAPQSVKNQIGDKTTDADYYVMLVNRNTGELVYANSKGNVSNEKEGYPLFRFIPKSDRLFNVETGSKVNQDALRSFIASKGFFTEITKSQEGVTKYLIRNNITKEEEVYNDREQFLKSLIEKANKYHKDFINNIDKQLTEGKNVYLVIKGMNQGIPVTKKDKETGKLVSNNLLEVLKNSDRGVSINDKGNLIGAEIITFVNNTAELPNGLKVSGRPGTSIMYIRKTKEIIPLNTSYLSNEDVEVLLHLIATAKENTFLSDLSLDLPKDKYVILGGKKQTKLKIFGKGSQYSIINSLTYWGRARKQSDKDIYIDRGRVYFGNSFLDISNVLDFSKNQDLIKFLKNKKYNIAKSHLTAFTSYFHPIMKDGKITFKRYNSYVEYLFENGIPYTTMASSNENNYNKNLLFLSRNFIFETSNNGDPIILNSLNNKPTTNTPTPNPVQKQDVTTTTSGNYKTLDQITPSNSDEYNFENLENKYIKIQVGENWFITKINSDGNLELIKTNIPGDKPQAYINANNESVKNEKDKNSKINMLLFGFLEDPNNPKIFLVEPMNEVDPEDPAKVEEEKEKCETGVSNTTSTTASVTPITNTRSIKKDYSKPKNIKENNNNPDEDL